MLPKNQQLSEKYKFLRLATDPLYSNRMMQTFFNKLVLQGRTATARFHTYYALYLHRLTTARLQPFYSLVEAFNALRIQLFLVPKRKAREMIDVPFPVRRNKRDTLNIQTLAQAIRKNPARKLFTRIYDELTALTFNKAESALLRKKNADMHDIYGARVDVGSRWKFSLNLNWFTPPSMPTFELPSCTTLMNCLPAISTLDTAPTLELTATFLLLVALLSSAATAWQAAAASPFAMRISAVILSLPAHTNTDGDWVTVPYIPKWYLRHFPMNEGLYEEYYQAVHNFATLRWQLAFVDTWLGFLLLMSFITIFLFWKCTEYIAYWQNVVWWAKRVNLLVWNSRSAYRWLYVHCAATTYFTWKYYNHFTWAPPKDIFYEYRHVILSQDWDWLFSDARTYMNKIWVLRQSVTIEARSWTGREQADFFRDLTDDIQEYCSFMESMYQQRLFMVYFLACYVTLAMALLVFGMGGYKWNFNAGKPAKKAIFLPLTLPLYVDCSYLCNVIDHYIQPSAATYISLLTALLLVVALNARIRNKSWASSRTRFSPGTKLLKTRRRVYLRRQRKN